MLKAAFRGRGSIHQSECLLSRRPAFYRLSARSSLTDGNDLLSPDLLLMKADLIALRDKMRVELKRPAYLIFTNNAMAQILKTLPTTDDEISSITPSGFKIYRPIYPDILRIVSKLSVNLKPEFDATVTRIPEETTKPVPVTINKDSGAKKVKIAVDPSLVTLSSSGSTAEILMTDLSVEQQQAAQIVLSGQNLFITGSAGTGKSFLMKFIVQELKKNYECKPKHPSGAVVVTAPTGVAAINIGGQTIHSFAGIGQSKIFFTSYSHLLLTSKYAHLTPTQLHFVNSEV